MVNTVSYRSGRWLSYTECGNPKGFPILMQHGMIASINDSDLFGHLIAVGARVISIARPGYGKSSPYEMKDVAEWGEIVSILANDLHLSQFDVFGISSGAPYSYSISYRLESKTRNVFILSGTPALFDNGVVKHWPYPIKRNADISELQALARGLFFSNVLESDLLKNDIRDSMMNDCFGIALDLRLRCMEWGFPLSEVKARVHMRHSKKDNQVPFVTAELTSKMLPNCRMDVKEHGEHFSREVLDDFVDTVIAGYYTGAA